MTDYIMVPRQKLQEIDAINKELFSHTCDDKTMKLSSRITKLLMSIQEAPTISSESVSIPKTEFDIWGYE